MNVNTYQVHLPQDEYYCTTDEESAICPIFDPTDTETSEFTFKWTDRNTGAEVLSECLPVYGMSVGLQSWDLVVTDQNGCKAYGNTEFFIINEPVANVEDQVMCSDGDSVVLIAQDLSHNTWTTYRWWKLNNPYEIIGYEGILEVDEYGRYVAEITDNRSGCVVLDTARAHVYPVPEFDIIGYDGSLCSDKDTLYIDRENLTGFHIEWSSETPFEGDKNSRSIIVDKTGVYYLTVTDLNSPLECSKTQFIDVIANDKPLVNLRDTVVCSADAPVELIAQDPEHTDYITYQWFDANDESSTVIGTEGVFHASEPGLYVVALTDELSGCMNFDTARVEFNWNPEFNILGYDEPTCDETVELYLDRTPSDFVSVTWYKNEVLWKENVYQATVVESGSYKVVMKNLTEETACETEHSVNVWLNESLTVQVEDIEVCEDEPSILRASLSDVTADRYAFNWYDIYDEENKLHTGIQFDVPKTSYYMVEVEDLYSACIVARDTAYAQLNPLPTFGIGGYEGPTCADSIQLFIEERSLEGLTVEWYFNDAKYLEGVSSDWVSASGTYEIVLTDTTKETMCVYRQSLDVTVNDFPTVDILPSVDTLNVCMGEEFELSVSTDRPASILWNTGQENSLIIETAKESMWYEVIVTDKNGCQSTDQIYVKVQKVEFDLEEVVGVCSQDQPAEICVAEGFVEYEWRTEDGTLVSQTNCLTTSILGTYSLTVYNELGCSTTKNVQVVAAIDQELELLNFPSLCEGDDYAIIEVTPGFAEYYWDGATTSSGSSFTAYELGTYEVIAVTAAGCETVLLVDVVDCCGPKIDMLDTDKGKTIVFTPFTSPGKDDLFLLNYKYIDVEQFEMRIFSRWGQEVFYTTDPDKAWDGRVFGKEAPSDVYQVIINFVGCEDQLEVKKSEILQLYLAK